MFKNYVITAIRNLTRNKTYTFINVLGLALGISAALVLFKIVLFEKSFDKTQPNYEDIYRVTREEVSPNSTGMSAGVPNPFTEAFKIDFPDYGMPARVFYDNGLQLSVKQENGVLQHFQLEEGVSFADPDLLKIFDFNILIGDPEVALAQPNSVIISESLANKLFGASATELDQVIGRTFELNNKSTLSITAVMADPAQNTVLPFEIIVEYEALENHFDFFFPESWSSTSSSAQVYILKSKNVTEEQIEEQLPAFEDKYMEEDASINNFSLQPFSMVHFQPEYGAFGDRVIDQQMIMIPTLVAIFLVLTACVNFINLATAQAVKRSKEVGIRKVLGGEKRQLIFQFMGETFFLTMISVLISLGVAELAMSNFSELIGYELSLDLFNDTQLLGLLVITTLAVTLLAGIYPSFILSSLKPVVALKSKGQSAMSGKGNLRKGLVIFQFAISQILAICTLIVISQMNYFENKDLGFRKSSIINFNIPERDKSKFDLISNQLRSNARISNVSFAFSTPSSTSTIGSTFNYAPLESESDFDASFKIIDANYLELFDIKLLAGRNLTASDTAFKNAIVSEKVLKTMNISDPETAIGVKIETGFNGEKTIVGVVKDFHAVSLKMEIPALILLNYPEYYYIANIQFEGDENETKDIIASIENVWQDQYPDYIFDHAIYSETLLESYDGEANMLSLFQVFSGIAILIGCLGLYGLISFMANQKTKEIGVRKVLGASIQQILGIFSKELIVLILIAFVIAAPVAYYFMSAWLQDFEYSINIGAWVFLVAMIFTLVIGGVTTGFRSIRAARANPVDSLRSE